MSKRSATILNNLWRFSREPCTEKLNCHIDSQLWAEFIISGTDLGTKLAISARILCPSGVLESVDES